MLSRASSDAGTRLRRSKSTSTVHTYRPPATEHVDPQLAQHYAVAAATTAFARANGIALTDGTSRGSDLARSKSNASCSSQGSHFLARKSSFRSVQTSKMASLAEAPPTSRPSTVTTDKFPSVHLHATPCKNHSSLSTQSSIARAEDKRPNSQPQLLPKLHRQSVSSSVTSQQLRKARSMYYASSVQTGSPIARPPAKYLVTPPPPTSAPDTLAFPIRNVPSSPSSALVSPRLPVRILSGEDVNNARDRYLQTFRERQVKQKPSILLAPFRKRQDKIRNPMALSTTGINPQGGNLMPTEVAQEESLQDFKPLREKRSFSNSLRHKFKKVFRRSSKGKATQTVPAQQAEASRDYFGDYTTHTRSVASGPTESEIPSPDDLVLHRVNARSPSLEHGRPAFARPDSRNSSRSLHSESELNNSVASRVTSWSNSSTGGTLTQREIKRLTVIHEAKDSIGSETDCSMAPSSSVRNPALLPGLNAFREPMPMESLMEEASPTIDPKRVFSALMKEIDAGQAPQSETELLKYKAVIEGDVFGIAKDKPPPKALTAKESLATATNKPSSLKTSSMKSLGRVIRSTIRTVTPSEKRTSPLLENTASVRGRVRIPRSNDTVSSGSSDTDTERTEESSDNMTGIVNFRMRPRKEIDQRLTSGSVVTPTREQLQIRMQKSRSRWQTPLEGNYGPSPDCNQKHNTVDLSDRVSGYEHAPMSVETECSVSQPAIPLQEGLSTPTSASSRRPRPLFSPLSPSVYSRNTDGLSILPNDSVMSLNGTEDDAGSAVIITSTAVKSYTIGTPARGLGAHSARSSKDWRAWLSHEISELGCSPREELVIHDVYTSPTSHRRELTEITDEASRTRTSSPTLCTAVPEMSSSTLETPARLGSPARTDMSLYDAMSASEPSSDVSTVRRVSTRTPLDPVNNMDQQVSNLMYKTSAIHLNDSPKLSATAPRSRSKKTLDNSPWTNKRSEVNEDAKENAAPELNVQAASLCRPSPPHVNGRPSSLQLISSSTLNRKRSCLVEYTTSTNEAKASPERPSTASGMPRMRLTAQSVSPIKLVTRPKSAFDIRAANMPNSMPGPLRIPGHDGPKKKREMQRPIGLGLSCALDENNLRMAAESPVATMKPPSPLFSKRSIPAGPLGKTLHMRTSTSTLALNKEPSPGIEERGIDALVEVDNGIESHAGRGRSSTPGQRMAEQFLSERIGGSEAASPVNIFDEDTGAQGRDFTPAFV